MGRTVLDAVIGWIGGLEDAPAENTADALQVAAKLEAAPPEHADGDFDGLLEDAIEAARNTYEFSGPGYLAYIPGGGLFTAALAEFLRTSAEPVRRLVAAEPRDGPDRRERDPVDVRALRLPAPRRRRASSRRAVRSPTSPRS